MSADSLPDYIRYLQNIESYPQRPDSVDLLQTHISFVLLAGSFVYKWKKPVDFGFLNFSTLEKRKYYCKQELQLNRRLCPDLYLSLVTVTREGDSFCLDGNGEVVEYGIKMKRMPEEDMMGNVIAAGQLTRDHLDGIIEVLVPFYKEAASTEAIGEFGRAESVAVNVLENFDQTEQFVDGPALSREQFERIGKYSRQFLANETVFDARVAQGMIHDCHGDMYSANICLTPRVSIFDCIEFNERFRYTDVAADVAFLAMDLDFHGLEDMSAYFISAFADKSGDQGVGGMLDFYKCYRAYVRGKIGLFTASDPAVDPATSDACTDQAGKYFALADKYASSGG